jgi:hypothetical protein
MARPTPRRPAARRTSFKILLGDGSGGFAAPTVVAVGQDPFAIVSGDVNGDGKIDLATANTKSTNISLLVGNGDGTFVPATVPVGAATPNDVAIADVTGDGHPDLVVASDDGVRILPGPWTGAGFGPPFQLNSKLVPFQIAIADLNRDGRQDIVSTNSANNVSVFVGLGGTSFQTLPPQDASNSPYAVVIGDFTADGIPDVAVANARSDDVSVLEGLGNGSLRAGRQFRAGRFPLGLVGLDVTADGRSDLVVGTLAGTTVLPSRALTPGIPTTAKARTTCPTPRRVVAGDAIGCVALFMSPAQVREILGPPLGSVRDLRDGTFFYRYGREFVVFDVSLNYVSFVGTTRPVAGLANGVKVGGPEALVKKRYPRATCSSGRRGERTCTVRHGKTSITGFVLKGGKITEIFIALQ